MFGFYIPDSLREHCKEKFTLLGSGISLPFALDFFFLNLIFDQRTFQRKVHLIWIWHIPALCFGLLLFLLGCICLAPLGIPGKDDDHNTQDRTLVLTRWSMHHTLPYTWHTRVGLCWWVQLRGMRINPPLFSNLHLITWEGWHGWYLWRWRPAQRQGSWSRCRSSWSCFGIVSSEKVILIKLSALKK